MKKLTLTLILSFCFFTLPDYSSAEGHSARCTGSRYCRACKNCSRCQHCSAGGTCGVCADDVELEEKPAPILRLPRRKTTESKTADCISLAGKVVGVADGDTITVLDDENTQHKIRLQGIDAPEKGQAFGTVSKQNLSSLVFGKVVDVECDKLDRYGRMVAKVSIDGVDVGLEQIRAGLAWHYKQYQNEQSTTDRKAYTDAEDNARNKKSGLWKDAQPVAPWNFRKGK